MNCYIKFYKENPKAAACATIVGIASLAAMILNIAQSSASGAIFNENDCKMVRNNNNTNSNPGRRLWVPAGIPDEDQPTYSCPTTPQVCNEACINHDTAAALTFLSAIVLLCAIMAPGFNDAKITLKAKGYELGLWTKKPEEEYLNANNKPNFGTGNTKDQEDVESGNYPGNGQ